MQIAMVGLGRMGGNMVTRLQRGGHQCVVFALDPDALTARNFPNYEPRTWGPAEAEELVARDGRTWRTPT